MVFGIAQIKVGQRFVVPGRAKTGKTTPQGKRSKARNGDRPQHREVGVEVAHVGAVGEAGGDECALERARLAGLDPAAHLNGFDAYPLFEKLGDTIQTGPTGNNVRYIRVLLAY